MRTTGILARLAVVGIVGVVTIGLAGPALADDFSWSSLPYAQSGDYGGQVIGAQTAMVAKGYYYCGPACTVDGDFGPNTYDAVFAYQQDLHLSSVDGIVGPETWANLQDGLSFIGGGHPNYAINQLGNTTYFDGVFDGGCTWNSFINGDAYPSVFPPRNDYRMALTYIQQEPQYTSCMSF
ncbi:MAG: peptidoglycan-binding protein [Actinomycetota bacterium]|nr:peptidoglycan-binding protein [Actinomycetota bacterium]